MRGVYIAFITKNGRENTQNRIARPLLSTVDDRYFTNILFYTSAMRRKLIAERTDSELSLVPATGSDSAYSTLVGGCLNKRHCKVEQGGNSLQPCDTRQVGLIL